MRYAICYVSSANADLSRNEINDLLKRSEDYNNSHNIKGLLLFSEGNFFHVMEGDKIQAISLFSRIQKDSRHHSIIQILGHEQERGSYDGFVSDYVTELNKYDPAAFFHYLEPIAGMDDKTQMVVKKMLEVFIETSK